MAGVDINELRATVDLLNRRFQGSGVKMILELMSTYYELIPPIPDLP